MNHSLHFVIIALSVINFLCFNSSSSVIFATTFFIYIFIWHSCCFIPSAFIYDCCIVRRLGWLGLWEAYLSHSYMILRFATIRIMGMIANMCKRNASRTLIGSLQNLLEITKFCGSPSYLMSPYPTHYFVVFNKF